MHWQILATHISFSANKKAPLPFDNSAKCLFNLLFLVKIIH
ncbi:hypothetical protein VCHA53O466_50231 [Vibrio chagasii]|nr:hypothetical protein VCHA53O466_50231 [Vibrio chagasii]